MHMRWGLLACIILPYYECTLIFGGGIPHTTACTCKWLKGTPDTVYPCLFFVGLAVTSCQVAESARPKAMPSRPVEDHQFCFKQQVFKRCGLVCKERQEEEPDKKAGPWVDYFSLVMHF